ncbi:Hypothetical predicted protein [Mytilus galloprovincialis]|uniref:ShKT domain-containing protein n=1 Tax=Mytilus galloprovincialis TaxID=29158 RepID=A0A8B6GWM7_MYTGA|nr:Hypothetical predicted protein [Mytilus galloprovincialis]
MLSRIGVFSISLDLGGGSMTLGVGTLVSEGGEVNGGNNGVACVDKIGNGADYAREGTCTAPSNTEWVKDNCARTCLCCKYVTLEQDENR